MLALRAFVAYVLQAGTGSVQRHGYDNPAQLCDLKKGAVNSRSHVCEFDDRRIGKIMLQPRESCPGKLRASLVRFPISIIFATFVDFFARNRFFSPSEEIRRRFQPLSVLRRGDGNSR